MRVERSSRENTVFVDEGEGEEVVAVGVEPDEDRGERAGTEIWESQHVTLSPSCAFRYARFLVTPPLFLSFPSLPTLSSSATLVSLFVEAYRRN
jgi:hypothetical protein